ncbi:hypothetical protein SteCoe_31159 [Stentor coeruleus]|uniref:Uncharacterized protein n=1 Tax=Stentor coeruleus TaxID=5963 RepID=A0A1R2B1Y6_9CILI|nr:hypothetical protein SteCoe_31159 [Stentor coeruleus]
MRHTVLWDQKQPTPDSYFPKVTRYGRAVSMKHKPISNLMRAKRFPQYEIDANRVGANVAPGAYNQDHYSIISSTMKTPKSAFYFYKHEDLTNNSHYYRDFSTTVPNFVKHTHNYSNRF